MALTYAPLVPQGRLALVPAQEAGEAFEHSVTGAWKEPEHGAVLHRCPTRIASFSWRAHGLAQGLCQPPDDGHLAEWSHNLGGVVRFLGDSGTIEGGQTRHRALLRQQIVSYPGGFATCGAIAEGVDLRLAEGWHGARSATHLIAVVALPDGHTTVGLQFCRTDSHRTYLAECKGLHLNVPNDLFNDFRRHVRHARGETVLHSPPPEPQVLDLESLWANIDGRVGVVGLYGDTSLKVSRADRRRGGRYASLYVEEVCLGYRPGVASVDPDTVVLDVGWAVLSAASAARTASLAGCSTALKTACDEVRGAIVVGLDGHTYIVIANWGDGAFELPVSRWLEGGPVHELAPGGSLSSEQVLTLAVGEVSVLSVRTGGEREKAAP
jgi:hypothetical protein